MAGSAQLDEVRGKVERFLKEAIPDVSVDEQGDFMVRLGSAVTWVGPIDWEDGRTLVRVWSVTNVGMSVDAELTKFLVTTNGRLLFGGFRLDEAVPAVMMVHCLLGEYLNRMELVTAVAAVAGTADHFAPEIKERFGGKLFTDS